MAEEDVLRAVAWYEGQRAGLGVKFLDRVNQAIERIAQGPQGHTKVIREAWKVELERFPNALWYTIETDESIVIACLHGRRDRVLAKERAHGVIELRKPKL
jgi:plasmid stabilization system protein ParE